MNVNAGGLARTEATGQVNAMRKKHPPSSTLSLLARLTAASAETIYRHYLLMARGRCSPAEYRRMVREKQEAAGQTAAALLRGQTDAAELLLPWQRRASANAKRLRRGKP